MLDTGLNQRVVLITGANNPYGIGAATARAFAAQGASVFLHYWRQPAPEQRENPTTPGEAFYSAQQEQTPERLIQEIRAGGGRAESWEADLSHPEVVPELLNRAEQALGQVDILVNNAAYWEADTFLPSHTELQNRLVELWTSRSPTINAGICDRMFGERLVQSSTKRFWSSVWEGRKVSASQ